MIEALAAPPEAVLTDLLELERRAVRASFWYYVTNILHRQYVPHVHGDIIAELERSDPQRAFEILIALPRGHFKSSLLCDFASWTIIIDRGDRWVCVSLDKAPTKDNCRLIEQNLEDPRVVELFGDFNDGTEWNEYAFTVCDRPPGVRGSTYEGTTRNNFVPGVHCEHLWFDDIDNQDTTRTVEAIEKTREIDELAYPLADRPKSRRYNTFTYWDYEDMGFYKGEKFGLYVEDEEAIGRARHKRVNGIRSKSGRQVLFFKPIYNEDGSILFPEEWTEERIQAKRDEMRPHRFAAQYLLDPIARSDARFKPEMFHYVTDIPKEGRVFFGIDMARSRGRGTDHTGFVGGIVSEAYHYTIFEAKRHKWTGKEIIDGIFERDEKWHDRTPMFVIELDAYAAGLKLQFDAECRQRGIFPYCKWIPAGGRINKDLRLEATEVLFLEKRIDLLKGQTEELEAEALGFPGEKKKDVFDAFANIVEIAREVKVFRKKEEPKNRLMAMFQRNTDNNPYAGMRGDERPWQAV